MSFTERAFRKSSSEFKYYGTEFKYMEETPYGGYARGIFRDGENSTANSTGAKKSEAVNTAVV